MTTKDKIRIGLSVVAMCAMVSCGGGSGSGEGPTPITPTPTVSIKCTTGEAYAVTEASATVTGSATITGAKAASGTAVFYYAGGSKTAIALKDSGTKVQAGSVEKNGGSFSSTITGLDAGTTYSYVAAVTIDGKEALGSVSTFKTTAVSETGAASAIKSTSATLTGTFNQPGSVSGTSEYGFVYGTDSAPQLGKAGCTSVAATNLNGNKQYTVEVTGLTPSTTYYYRAYAKNGSTWYGEIKNFKTANLNASVSTLDATGISQAAATLAGRLTLNSQEPLATTSRFYYSTTAQTVADLKASGTAVAATWGAEGNFSAQVTGLTINTKYYFVAEATVAGVTFTGTVKNFSTASKSGDPDDWGNDGGKIEFTPKN